MRAMPTVPSRNTKGEATPAWPPISEEMKITPIVGEMNARDIARALGKPSAFRFNPPAPVVSLEIDELVD